MKLFSTSSLVIPVILNIIITLVIPKIVFLLLKETLLKKVVNFDSCSFFIEIFLLGTKFKRVGSNVKVIIFPVTVQGDNCAKEVIEGINFFHQERVKIKGLRPNLLIIARGGGSFEDLWPFNDENLVRTVSEAKIPIISY